MHNNTARLLENHGIRPSLQRLQVFDYLLEHKTHPTADSIYSGLAPFIPTLSKTTVYNALKTFLEHKLVQTVIIENDELRYDIDTSEHIHFKCTKCGVIYDIFSKFSLSDQTIPNGFIAEKTQLNVWGICKECADISSAGSR